MFKKSIVHSLLTIMLFLFVACDSNAKVQYKDARLYDNTGQWMNEDFLVENLTRWTYYNGIYLDDSPYPKSTTHLLKSKEEFDFVFAELPSEIDFTQKMICIHVFTCHYIRPYEINSIYVDDQVLRIKVKSIKPKGAVGDAVPSWQRCFVVEMDKLDIDSVEFVVA